MINNWTNYVGNVWQGIIYNPRRERPKVNNKSKKIMAIFWILWLLWDCEGSSLAIQIPETD